MNKRQAQRLLRVATALRQSPNPQAFSMDLYLHNHTSLLNILGFEYDGNGDVVDGNGVKVEANFCNTPACALGHYGARNDLQRVMHVGKSILGRPTLRYYNNKCVDYYDNRIRELFGITGDQAEELFSGDGCGGAKTPIEAAKYIEKFVRKTYGPISL